MILKISLNSITDTVNVLRGFEMLLMVVCDVCIDTRYNSQTIHKLCTRRVYAPCVHESAHPASDI
jgi:hypothetical protein